MGIRNSQSVATRTVRLAVLCWIMPAVPSNAEPITWMVEGAPPFFGTEVAGAPQGPGDQMLRQIFSMLPNDSHHIVYAETARALHEMDKKDAICDLVLQRNPARQKVAEFSQRPLIVPSFRLLIRKESLAAFQHLLDRDGQVRLDRLAASSGLRGGYVLAQANPPEIDDLIKDPSRRLALEPITSARLGKVMLVKGRLDFFFRIGIEGEEAVPIGTETSTLALPIAKVPKMVELYIACSKKPVGQRVIASLDQSLADNRVWARFVEPLQPWLEPDDFAITVNARPPSN